MTRFGTRHGKVFKKHIMAGAMGAIFVLSVSGWAVAEHAVKNTLPADLAPYSPSSSLSGRLTIAGSDTMQPLVGKVAAAFKLLHPGVDIAVQGGGSSQAIR